MVELKYYKLRSKFDQDVESSSVTNDDLVFIEDTKELYTHGTFFGQDSYCILNYNNIVDSTGDPYVGNIDSTTNIYIQCGVFIIPAITYKNVGGTYYIGSVVQATNDTLDVHYVSIKQSAPPNRTFSAEDASFETSAMTDVQKTTLANISREDRTYITGGEGVVQSETNITVPSKTFSDGSNSIPEDNLVLFSASQSQAGVMSADDKKSLDDVVGKLSTYDVIKTKALFGDKFIVHIDGVLEYNDIRSNVMTSLAPSGSHDTVDGLYLVKGYVSGSQPTAMLKVNDNYYTQWNATTTYYSDPIPAYNKKVGDSYVIKDSSENLSTQTLFVYKHYADQSIQQMYHVNGSGVVASATEALNDYVYEQVLLN